MVFGLSSVLLPDLASSVGRAWGALSIVGGMVFISVTTWEARQTEDTSMYKDVVIDQGSP